MGSMKSERKEAAEIVRRLDDAALRAKRGRGLDALKEWDTAEFDGFSTRSASGLEQLRHWDEVPTSQVIPLTPLPLKDVPGIEAAPDVMTAPRPTTSEARAKGDLYAAEMPTAAPLIQPAAPPVAPPVAISQATASPQVPPTLSPSPLMNLDSTPRGTSLKTEPAIRRDPLRGGAPSSLTTQPTLGAGAIQNSVAPTMKSLPAEGAGAPAVRLTATMGVALTRNSALTQPRLSTLSTVHGFDGQSKNRPGSAPRSYEGSREPKLVTKPQAHRPVLKVKPDEAEDFTPAQRAGINAGITIGTGLALAAVTVWLLVWFVSQSMSMVMDSLRAFVQ